MTVMPLTVGHKRGVRTFANALKLKMGKGLYRWDVGLGWGRMISAVGWVLYQDVCEACVPDQCWDC